MQTNNDTPSDLPPLADGEKLWPKTITFGDHSFQADDLAEALESAGQWFYHTAKAHGFYDADVDTSLPTKLMMMVGELSEAFEAVRDGNPPSEKIPGYSQLEEELADVVIRLLGDAAGRELNVVGAIVAKGLFNEARPFKHGKSF